MSESPEARVVRMLDWLEKWSDRLSRPDCVEQLPDFAEAVADLHVTLLPTSELYLIWSNDRRGWWGPGRSGYTSMLLGAGWYSHEAAMDICLNAMPGAKDVLNELPVRLRDVRLMLEAYRVEFGDRGEQWM